MEKIKEYKGIIIIVLVIILGAFYWTSVRPVQIKKNCSYVTKELPAYVSDEQSSRCGSNTGNLYECFLLEKEVQEKPSQPKKEFLAVATEREYNLCLRQHGL